MAVLDWLKDSLPEIGTGALVIVSVTVAAIGRRFGAKAPEQAHVELAGAVIDSSDVKSIVAALNINTAAVKENSEVRREGDGRMIAQLDEANNRLERIKDELIRGPSSAKRY
ncbi:MAG: hypothetical protein JWQ44_2924 [Chthoniobacter sp.]|nr:hypothetical protein [Chthoniobacter sp.]